MANKSVMITEPTANDVQSITIIYDGAGKATSIEIGCMIQTSDGEGSHRGNRSSAPADWTAAQKVEFATMAATAAALVAADKGF